nr:radical SAM protein [Rhizobium sp. CSW-27]
MNVSQVARGLELARHFRALGKVVIAGGAHVSLAPEAFEGKVDCIVAGEFEEIAEEVTGDLKRGQLKPRYNGRKADLSRARLPRWDLYPNDRAVWGTVQTSRGCPFECEFCDVIQYLGRVQRHKPADVVLRELQYLYELGYRQIHLSDDNFTVYRKRTYALLEAIAGWNGREGREPVTFMTQASIDMARDEDLLRLCNVAGVRDVFIGLETDNEEALRETKKRQNLNQDLVAQCEKISAAGVYLTSGMMVGFDSDRLDCFERQFAFGMSLPIVMLRVTVVVASLATPLHARMKREGRLVGSEEGSLYVGSDLLTNIIPANMTREQLAQGAEWLIRELMRPENAIRRFAQLAAVLQPAPEHLRRHGRPSQSSRAPMELMRIASRNPDGKKVVEAVADLSRARPEIARDLSSLLISYLNTFVPLEKLSGGDANSRPAFMANLRHRPSVSVATVA